MARLTIPLNRRAALGALGAALASAAVPRLQAQAARNVTNAPHAISPPCGPQLPITVPYAFGQTGSPTTLKHTHAFSVSLAHGTVADGQTVTVVGATSGVLQMFPQHTHQIDSTGVLGVSCGFSTKDGTHPFTLHAADFVMPS